MADIGVVAADLDPPEVPDARAEPAMVDIGVVAADSDPPEVPDVPAEPAMMDTGVVAAELNPPVVQYSPAAGSAELSPPEVPASPAMESITAPTCTHVQLATVSVPADTLRILAKSVRGDMHREMSQVIRDARAGPTPEAALGEAFSWALWATLAAIEQALGAPLDADGRVLAEQLVRDNFSFWDPGPPAACEAASRFSPMAAAAVDARGGAPPLAFRAVAAPRPPRP